MPIISHKSYDFTILLEYIFVPGAFPIFNIIHKLNSLGLSSLFQAISRAVALISLILTHAISDNSFCGHVSIPSSHLACASGLVWSMWSWISCLCSVCSSAQTTRHLPIQAAQCLPQGWASRGPGWQTAHLRLSGAQLAASTLPVWVGECHYQQGHSSRLNLIQAIWQEGRHFIFSVTSLI